MKKTSLFRLILVVFCFTLIQINSNSQVSTEIKKIETIMNLSRFIDWSQNKSFTGKEIKLYIVTDLKKEKNYEATVRNLSMYHDWKMICIDNPTDFEEGSVVFITNEKKKDTDEIIRISTIKNILTISDNTANFCQKGGMINIVENSGKIKFEINYRNIQNKSLDISSKLLALSKIY